MKRIFKSALSLILILCFTMQTYAYTFDELMKGRIAITDSILYNRKELTGDMLGALKFSNATAWSVLKDACKNIATEDEKFIKTKSRYWIPFVVEFGSYKQDGNSKEPIEWIVLEKKNGMALLMSLKMLDYRAFHISNEKKSTINVDKILDSIRKKDEKEKTAPKDYQNAKKKWEDAMSESNKIFQEYANKGRSELKGKWLEALEKERKAHEEYMKLVDKYQIYSWQQTEEDESSNEGGDDSLSYSWNKCALNKWLNEEFYNNAFSSSERKKIKGLKNGTKTDNVFILSSEDIYYYFRIANQWNISWNNGKIKGVPWTATDWTEYSKKLFNKDSKKDTESYYWTREHAVNPAMNVAKDLIGKRISSSELDKKYGVRPCIWVEYDPKAFSPREQEWNKFTEIALELGLEYAKNKFFD